MATQQDISVVLPLNHIDELFTAPDANPFSSNEVDILGESGMDHIQKRITRKWPRKPGVVYVTLQLPADQIKPDLTDRTRTAIRRYCSERIDNNRLRRGLVLQRSWRQFVGAIIGTLVAIGVIALIGMNPFGLIPEIVQGVLIVLAAFAIAVLIFDSLWSLVFEWIPFVQDNTVHTILQGMDLRIEALEGNKSS